MNKGNNNQEELNTNNFIQYTNFWPTWNPSFFKNSKKNLLNNIEVKITKKFFHAVLWYTLNILIFPYWRLESIFILFLISKFSCRGKKGK